MKKKKAGTMELRFYEVPQNEYVLALLGDSWIRDYGHDEMGHHFHNLMEIGYCRSGGGELFLDGKGMLYQPAMVSVIPANYPHVTISNIDEGPSFWVYLFLEPAQLIAEMYPYYEKLIKKDGWDNYDKIFTKYFDKLVKVRKDIFEDDYISDEVMFTALEANVKTYGETLTGTEDVFDENTGIQTSFESIGKYQKAYGEDYKFDVKYTSVTDLDLAVYKENYDEESFTTYGVTADDISEVKEYTVDVYCGDKKVASTDVVTVRIGKSWYVDNTQTVTEDLYNFYK